MAQPATVLGDESLAAATAGLVVLEPVEIGSLRGFPDVTTAYRVVDAP